MDHNPPDTSVHGIFQARILEWVAISFSRESSRPRNQTYISRVFCIGRQILYHCITMDDDFFFFFLLLATSFQTNNGESLPIIMQCSVIIVYVYFT